MARLAVFLKDAQFNALCKLAEYEYRDPRSQAAIIISKELERRGLISQEHADSNKVGSQPSQVVNSKTA